MENRGIMPIELRGVSVNNLKGIDLDIPYGKMIVLCGRSGSGKSSLAMDTLYAEGQRRYIESFSAYTRQFLEKLEKPEAEQIDGIPAAIAVTSKSLHRMGRSTVGTATETADYLRLLFSKIGTIFCPCCGREVMTDSPQSILERLYETETPENGGPERRIQIAFAPELPPEKNEFESLWKERGFVRGIALGEPFRLDEGGIPAALYEQALGSVAKPPETVEIPQEEQLSFFDGEEDPEPVSETELFSGVESEEPDDDSEADSKTIVSFFPDEPLDEEKPCPTRLVPPVLIVVDRLTLGKSDDSRIVESLETALALGDGTCHILSSDGRHDRAFSRHLACDLCGIEFPAPEPKLFSFNNPLGACPTCEGFGNLMMYDLDLIVPNRSKTLREGALAPWSTPAYQSKWEELLDLAGQIGLPVDVPFGDLDKEQLHRLLYGFPGEPPKERPDSKKTSKKTRPVSFEGLFGFFRRLERQKYKMHIRVFLSRWRSYRPCPSCGGTRLRPESLSVRISGKNIADLSGMSVTAARDFFRNLELTDSQHQAAKTAREQIRLRLDFLEEVGLGYLTLSRTMRTLSGGEQRRVGLTSALGSSLVDMLYVLDEPSVGLHPKDTETLLGSVRRLRDRGNTVVVVEHEDAFLRAADAIVEVGPGAGEAGGTLVFQGTTEEMIADPQSLTGAYLSGKRTGCFESRRRLPENGVIELVGCRGNNLRNLTVAFPLGMLCVVTGVSGAGKSSLVQETLYPALCRHFGKENVPGGLPVDQLITSDIMEDVVLVDQGPIGRSPRSNPATYLKIFDEIRTVFASTVDAKARHFTPGKFSFNVEGGRCEYCKGDGFKVVDMQFMTDMYVRCPQCHGKRYRAETLEISYRGRNIADVLDMTVREAFGFFRGQAKVQQKLKRLIDVGLDYVRLGQPANTLSGGESQRLKLAAYLSQIKKERTLFLLDEPTMGLHFADVVQLLDCFDALVETGHSLIVVEHNLQIIRAADYIVDLGPGAAEQGGRIVAQGTPEEIAENTKSETGRFLRG